MAEKDLAGLSATQLLRSAGDIAQELKKAAVSHKSAAAKVVGNLFMMGILVTELDHAVGEEVTKLLAIFEELERREAAKE